MRIKEPKLKEFSRKQWITAVAVLLLTVIHFAVQAQDANAGINEANQKVRSYFSSGSTFMYGLGGLMGLVGAIRVYYKWVTGEPDTQKFVSAWIGGCVFLIVSATILKAFFGM